jgi:hypothetical protein
MTKLEILQIVKTLTQDQADNVTISGYFDQLLDDLGRLTSDIMTELEVIPLIAEQEEYTLPANAVCEHAIFLDDRELLHTTVHHLESRNMNWRDHRGKPWAYTKDEQTARTFRVYPIPNFSSTATDWSEGEPLGRGFPSDALTIFYSSRANDKIPSWLVLPLVFQILSWEFARPSQHQSQAFSDFAAQLAGMTFEMIGVKWQTPPAAKGAA